MSEDSTPLPITLADTERLLFETRECIHDDNQGIGGWFERRGFDYESMRAFYVGLLAATTMQIARIENAGGDGGEALFELILTTFIIGWVMKEQYGKGRP